MKITRFFCYFVSLSIFFVYACSVPPSVRFEDDLDSSKIADNPGANMNPQSSNPGLQPKYPGFNQQGQFNMEKTAEAAIETNRNSMVQQNMQQQMLQNMQRNMQNMSASGMGGGGVAGGGMPGGGGMSGGGMSGGGMPGGGGMSGGRMPNPPNRPAGGMLSDKEMPGANVQDRGPDGSVMQDGTVGVMGGGPPKF